MYCVGLTGNIASGKSSAIRCFKSLGIPVVIADDIAREVTAPGQPALRAIQQHFGDAMLHQGHLNRSKLRQLIFKQPEERQWLESLLHPLIRRQIEMRVTSFKAPYCVIEIPLLLDRSHYPYLNRILVILSESERLIERVMARDQHTREEALAILAAQPDEAARRAIADDLVINEGSLADFEQKIYDLHEKYLFLANLPLNSSQ
ncbi:dephospho-CoA kinase [Legionella taurinensis]|uniref:Dephospho-CoA kinase n=1 Tax=Legionella taurinensis TaxID=70611 RepID=A0A3A5LDK8_9GAMM|nr:dephospho-CoA kinase [Legionella taurinensis]RJT45595.1 dephospho-CoA kinase [Legionella taurinensis]RJT66211.1 dephospho-CoA kinase [Legionella taurinensis]STY26261.1 dephospho-CoA kinase [Legionella taurinensis]